MVDGRSPSFHPLIPLSWRLQAPIASTCDSQDTRSFDSAGSGLLRDDVWGGGSRWATQAQGLWVGRGDLTRQRSPQEDTKDFLIRPVGERDQRNARKQVWSLPPVFDTVKQAAWLPSGTW